MLFSQGKTGRSSRNVSAVLLERHGVSISYVSVQAGIEVGRAKGVQTTTATVVDRCPQVVRPTTLPYALANGAVFGRDHVPAVRCASQPVCLEVIS